MEIKIPMRGESKTGNDGKKDSGRLQKQAPASLKLDAKMKSAFAWEDNAGAASAPIPLLSPLVLSPAPLWDAKDSGSEREDASMGTASPPSPAEGWRHPALPVAALEPVALVPFFEFQCSMVHNV